MIVLSIFVSFKLKKNVYSICYMNLLTSSGSLHFFHKCVLLSCVIPFWSSNRLEFKHCIVHCQIYYICICDRPNNASIYMLYGSDFHKCLGKERECICICIVFHNYVIIFSILFVLCVYLNYCLETLILDKIIILLIL